MCWDLSLFATYSFSLSVSFSVSFSLSLSFFLCPSVYFSSSMHHFLLKCNQFIFFLTAHVIMLAARTATTEELSFSASNSLIYILFSLSLSRCSCTSLSSFFSLLLFFFQPVANHLAHVHSFLSLSCSSCNCSWYFIGYRSNETSRCFINSN